MMRRHVLNLFKSCRVKQKDVIGTQTTKGTDLKNPITLGVTQWHKSPTVVLSTTPMTASPVRSKSLN